MRDFRWIAWVAAAALLGCGHTTPVRPTPKGNLQLQAEIGGPIASWGFPFPSPHATAGASYGLLDRLDAHAHVHLTPLIAGLAGVDVGSTFLLLEETGPIPALSGTARVYGFTDFTQSAAYFEGTAAASYAIGTRWLPYVSVTGFGQFAGGPILVSPAVGTQLWFDAFGVQAEARWFQPDYETQRTVIPWVGVGGRGALGLVLGVRWRTGVLK
ncbi:MAG: hypothetical protein WBV82_08875 [Myxococcaceae bacterium]